MSLLYVNENGATIGIEANRCIVQYKDGMKKSIPIESLEGITIMGQSLSLIHICNIWRYSPRNGDGSDIDVHAERLLDRKFGDIVPGMGTEASIISQSVTRLNVDNLEI